MNLEDGFVVSPIFALVDNESAFRSSLSRVLQNVEEIDSVLGHTPLSSAEPVSVQFLCNNEAILDLKENERADDIEVVAEVQFRIEVFGAYDGGCTKRCFADDVIHCRLLNVSS
jgi:hypothetical protein